MLLSSQHWHRGYRLFESPPDGANGGSLPADDSDIDANNDLDDAGKKALKAERAARRDADKAAKDAAAALADAQRALDAANADKAKRDAEAATQAEKDREAKGEFEQLAKDRERERDQAKADLAELQTKYNALRDAATGVVKSDFDSLPEEVREVYTGEADDPVAMLAFIPKGKKIAERMAGGEQNNTKEVEGSEPNPKPTAPAGEQQAKTDEQAARLNQGRYQ